MCQLENKFEKKIHNSWKCSMNFFIKSFCTKLMTKPIVVIGNATTLMNIPSGKIRFS